MSVTNRFKDVTGPWLLFIMLSFLLHHLLSPLVVASPVYSSSSVYYKYLSPLLPGRPSSSKQVKMKSMQALSTAALLAVARAQSDAIVNGDLAGDLSGDDWSSVSESANLTDSQTFTGRDVSSAYPAESQDGWQVRLAVKDNVPAPDSDDFLTATTISLSPPNEDDISFDESWRLCAHVFPVKDSSAVDGFGTEFEPGCKGIVAGECIEDLRKMGQEEFEAGCPSWEITPSCLRDLEKQEGWSVDINCMIPSLH